MNDDRAKFEALTDEQIDRMADSDECNPDKGGWGPKFDHRAFARAILASAQAASAEPVAPIDMVLHCPACGMQHIDAPEPHEADENEPKRPGGLWDNRPHRSHLCHGCGHIWRPADVPTNGVAAVKTKGKDDSPITTPAPAVAPAAVTEAEKVSGMICQPDGLKFDAFGEPRKRYVRVTLDGSHCVMRPSEGDTYVKDARESGDESPYVVADVWLSEREFDDLGEFNGF